jgi:copper chaperone CopZ
MKTQIIYSISGMTCNNCVAGVQAALAAFADEVTVTLKPPQVKLTEQKTDVKTLNEALKSVGNYVIGAEILPEFNAEPQAQKSEVEKSFFLTYKPLILVFFYILLVTLAVEIASGEFILHRFMPNFMAGFFLVFSFFKLLDLTGFAQSYAMYDLLAKKIPAYAYIYPFIELALGAAYLLGYRPMLINAITLIVMTFSSIGVILAVANKQKIRCACLGTGFNLPMTTVTIIEDLLMAVMALWMLI